MNTVFVTSTFVSWNGALHAAWGLLGISCIFYFFKSIIRVGVLNQRYQDPLAFGVGRIVHHLFRFWIFILPGGNAKRNDIMTWYWPCALIGVVAAWFLLVTIGFALLNLACGADETFVAAMIASGSALSETLLAIAIGIIKNLGLSRRPSGLRSVFPED